MPLSGTAGSILLFMLRRKEGSGIVFLKRSQLQSPKVESSEYGVIEMLRVKEYNALWLRALMSSSGLKLYTQVYVTYTVTDKVRSSDEVHSTMKIQSVSSKIT